MNGCIIDFDQAPVWDFYATIRGMTIPMTSPLNCEDVPDSPIPSQDEIDGMTERWPGLFVWLWRVLVGGPRVQREELPQDGGAGHARNLCRIILGDDHAELVGQMSTGECAQLIQSYMGCQLEWATATQKWASAIAGKNMNTKSTPPSVDESGAPMRRVTPGASVPISLNPKRHPLITGAGTDADDSKGGGQS